MAAPSQRTGGPGQSKLKKSCTLRKVLGSGSMSGITVRALYVGASIIREPFTKPILLYSLNSSKQPPNQGFRIRVMVRAYHWGSGLGVQDSSFRV